MGSIDAFESICDSNISVHNLPIKMEMAEPLSEKTFPAIPAYNQKF